MDVKEKLVELLDGMFNGECCIDKAEAVDFLIANGVTVQEWISVKDRLPKPNVPVLVTRDYGWGCVVDRDVLSKNGEWCYLERNCEVTHWMPLPEPHKGE